MLTPNNSSPRVTIITPDEAVRLLEYNQLNRPLNQQHVHRIARQIISEKWKFNGDTIKIGTNNDILDGQHRLWAIVEAGIPVQTIIVYGIESDAFATIDTLRKPRSGSDILALIGVTNYRATISGALRWLIYWQRNTLEGYRAPENRLENSDIEQAYRDNPGIARAADRCNKLRSIANPAMLTFFYYVVSNRNPDLAERMISTLENPNAVGMNDPFFKLRVHFLASDKRKHPLMTIALMIKAANAAYDDREVKILKWQSQGGSLAEPFPKLSIGQHNLQYVR